MFELTEHASEKIRQFLEGKEGLQSIRILMTEGGYKGPYLVMALDERKEGDEVFTEKGVTFLIEKGLFERVKPISIDYVHSSLGSGYSLKSELLKDMENVSVCHEICGTCQDVV